MSSSSSSHEEGPSATPTPSTPADAQPTVPTEPSRPIESPGPSQEEAAEATGTGAPGDPPRSNAGASAPRIQAAPPADATATARTLGEMWTTAGQVFGAVAASAGFVYLIGGTVMWLRFRRADLPADQAVSLMRVSSCWSWA